MGGSFPAVSSHRALRTRPAPRRFRVVVEVIRLVPMLASRMDFQPAPLMLVAPLVALQFAWYVGVMVLLFKIWGKVRHLPNVSITTPARDTPGL